MDAGAHVDFVTTRERGQAPREVRDGICIVRRGGRLTFYPWALWWLLLHRRRLDAVVDADCGIPVFSPLVLSRRRTAVVLLVHHVHLDQFATYFPPVLAWVGRFLERRAMPVLYRDRACVAVSASTVHEMRERLGWRGAVEIVHNGNATRAMPSAPGSKTDAVVVLGRLAAHKRVDDVVRAVALLRASRPDVRLDVVGKGPELDRLHALVDELDLGSRVSLHGFLDEESKADVVARCRLHVSASDAEGWGQVVIEAAGLGVPTLARDAPGMRDSIRDGITGWLIDDDTGLALLPARLAAGIEAALDELDDPAHREEMGDACRAWASEFDWARMHTSVVHLVAAAIGERR